MPSQPCPFPECDVPVELPEERTNYIDPAPQPPQTGEGAPLKMGDPEHCWWRLFE